MEMLNGISKGPPFVATIGKKFAQFLQLLSHPSGLHPGQSCLLWFLDVYRDFC